MTEFETVERGRGYNLASYRNVVIALIVVAVLFILALAGYFAEKSSADAIARDNDRLTSQTKTAEKLSARYKENAQQFKQHASVCLADYAQQVSITNRLRKVAAAAVSATTVEDYNTLTEQMQDINADEQSIDSDACINDDIATLLGG